MAKRVTGPIPSHPCIGLEHEMESCNAAVKSGFSIDCSKYERVLQTCYMNQFIKISQIACPEQKKEFDSCIQKQNQADWNSKCIHAITRLRECTIEIANQVMPNAKFTFLNEENKGDSILL